MNNFLALNKNRKYFFISDFKIVELILIFLNFAVLFTFNEQYIDILNDIITILFHIKNDSK